MRFRRLAVALVAFMVMVGAAAAQTSKGILAGVVRDSTGAVVSSANVTVTNQDTNETRSVKSESTGSYRVDAISPGNYTIHAELAGFQKFDAKDIVVRASIVTSYDPTLRVGAIDQTVEVQARTPQLDTDNASVVDTFSSFQIPTFPIFH